MISARRCVPARARVSRVLHAATVQVSRAAVDCQAGKGQQGNDGKSHNDHRLALFFLDRFHSTFAP